MYIFTKTLNTIFANLMSNNDKINLKKTISLFALLKSKLSTSFNSPSSFTGQLNAFLFHSGFSALVNFHCPKLSNLSCFNAHLT